MAEQHRNSGKRVTFLESRSCLETSPWPSVPILKFSTSYVPGIHSHTFLVSFIANCFLSLIWKITVHSSLSISVTGYYSYQEFLFFNCRPYQKLCSTGGASYSKMKILTWESSSWCWPCCTCLRSVFTYAFVYLTFRKSSLADPRLWNCAGLSGEGQINRGGTDVTNAWSQDHVGQYAPYNYFITVKYFC